MTRKKYYDLEIDIETKLKYENRKLKRELKAARKLLDRYNIAEEKGLIDENVIVPGKKRRKEAELKKYWACYTTDCSGWLELKRFGNRYMRVCNHCGKHTRSQLWDDTVKE